MAEGVGYLLLASSMGYDLPPELTHTAIHFRLGPAPITGIYAFCVSTYGWDQIPVLVAWVEDRPSNVRGVSVGSIEGISGKLGLERALSIRGNAVFLGRHAAPAPD
jgi:hypothetical protein